MAKIQMPDGQSFQLDDEIAQEDNSLRAALKVAYPDAANATFTREGGKDGKQLVVKVAKKAGTKGSVLADLQAAPHYVNEALLMQRRLEEMAAGGKLTWSKMLAMTAEIEKAAAAGDNAMNDVETARKTFVEADALAANTIPMGF